MTIDIERAQAEQLMAAFAVVLTHPACFSIQLLADLSIERLEDRTWRVIRNHEGQRTHEEIFEDVRDAVGFYLDLRDQLKLGMDYEGPTT